MHSPSAIDGVFRLKQRVNSVRILHSRSAPGTQGGKIPQCPKSASGAQRRLSCRASNCDRQRVLRSPFRLPPHYCHFVQDELVIKNRRDSHLDNSNRGNFIFLIVSFINQIQFSSDHIASITGVSLHPQPCAINNSPIFEIKLYLRL